jgi:hypothetical protein
MSLSYSSLNDTNTDVTVKADLLVMSLILAVSAGFIIFGTMEKKKYEDDDALRSVKNFPAVISEISRYDVTYISTNYNAKPKYVYNIEASKIEEVSTVFNLRSSNGVQSYTISETRKKPTEIKVTVDYNGVTSTKIIKEINFTRNIEEADVGKTINIEFDPNDMTNNISMAVDGLTMGQWGMSYGLIIVGILLLLFDIFLLVRYLRQ